VGLEAGLGSVAVVVEELLASGDVPGGRQNESRGFVHLQDFRPEIRLEPRVVDEATQSAGLPGGVDAETRKFSPLGCRREPRTPRLLPVVFSVCLEVVHVASLGQVHRVLALALDGVFHVDQISGVLDDEVAAEKVAGREDAAALEAKRTSGSPERSSRPEPTTFSGTSRISRPRSSSLSRRRRSSIRFLSNASDSCKKGEPKI
jgi:hypothetical protein